MQPNQPTIACICFDLDGTALTVDSQLAPTTVRALSHAAQQGIALVPATGRALDFVPEAVLSLPNLRYAITSNGAVVTDLSTQTCLRRVLLPAEVVAHLVTIIAEEQITAEAFVDGKAYGTADYVAHPAKYGIPDHAVDYIMRTRIAVDDISAFLLANAHQMDSIDLVVADPAQSTRLRAQLTAALPAVHVTSSGIHRVEFANQMAGKGKAMAFVLEKLGIAPENTAAVGDADNDTEMIALAGWGVAMGGASQSAQQAAQYITKTNAEDGLAHAVERMLPCQA